MCSRIMTFLRAVVPGLDSGFTRWNLVFLLVSCFVPWIYCVVFCTTWGVFISFNFAPLLDATAFPRLAESLGMRSMPMFHLLYNFLAHAVPCILTAVYPPSKLEWWHGAIAAAVHVGWGLCVSNGTLRLNKVYIEMQDGFWVMMWASAVATEIAAPICIYPFVTN